jgi:glycerol-3-phosphate dehydrogenase (NAD(P)+)
MTTQQQAIAVLGAGSWGSALALLLARNGKPVRLWGHEDAHMQALHTEQENSRHLPGHPFPKTLSLYTSLSEALAGISDVLIVVPSHAFTALLQAIKPLLHDHPRIMWGTKGIDPNTNTLLSDCVHKAYGDIPMAILSGPSFAREVAQKCPTAATVAGNNDALIDDVMGWFHCDYFRVYSSYDLIGSQVCGVVKNVLAVAAGLCDGMTLGINARSALITRGLAEMQRLCVAMGGDAQTVSGLCGLGDLVLTCTGDLSRNRRFGLALGAGKTLDETKREIGQAIEGVFNAAQVQYLAKEYNVEMPICTQVYRILQGDIAPKAALLELMAREPR